MSKNLLHFWFAKNRIIVLHFDRFDMLLSFINTETVTRAFVAIPNSS